MVLGKQLAEWRRWNLKKWFPERSVFPDFEAFVWRDFELRSYSSADASKVRGERARRHAVMMVKAVTPCPPAAAHNLALLPKTAILGPLLVVCLG